MRKAAADVEDRLKEKGSQHFYEAHLPLPASFPDKSSSDSDLSLENFVEPLYIYGEFTETEK
jgi:hypothetical protein